MFLKSIDTKYNDNCSLADFELLSAQTINDRAKTTYAPSFGCSRGTSNDTTTLADKELVITLWQRSLVSAFS